MDALIYERLSASLKLLGRHQGEPLGAYDEVALVYDAFAQRWDQRIAAPAFAHLYHLLQERIQPGASVLDAGAGTGERTLALSAKGGRGSRRCWPSLVPRSMTRVFALCKGIVGSCL